MTVRASPREPAIRVDMVHYWEDICYNAGPIVQPQAFRDIVVPRMKRVNEAPQGATSS
jgi:hypothetical protein